MSVNFFGQHYTCLIALESPVAAHLLELVVSQIKPDWRVVVVEEEGGPKADDRPARGLITSQELVTQYAHESWFPSLAFVLVLVPENDSPHLNFSFTQLSCPFRLEALKEMIEGLAYAH